MLVVPVLRTRFKMLRSVVVVALAGWAGLSTSAHSRPCIGDCDGSGSVSREEVVQLLTSALSGNPLADCLDGRIPTVVDALDAVVSRQAGCGPTPSLSPTPTPSAESCAGKGAATPTDLVGDRCAPAFPHHANVLWMEDDGTLTHNGEYLEKDGIKTRLDAVCPERLFDFAFVSTSNFDGLLLGSRGGGIAQYLTVCDTEESGLAHHFIDYRHCGPDDHLQGIMALPNLNYWALRNESVRRMTSVHELGHRWGALAYTTTPGAVIGFQHWHCPNVASGVDCFKIDSIMSEAPRPGFAYLDLYLMGMAASSEVPTYDYVAPDGGAIPVTIESIVEATGERVPAFPNAPTHFRLVWIVITPGGRTPDTCELDLAERWSELFPEWWHIATRGRGTVEVGLPTETD